MCGSVGWLESACSNAPATDRNVLAKIHRNRNSVIFQAIALSLIVSPLLDVASFYDPPYKKRFEPSVQINVDTGEEILQGCIDALVIQPFVLFNLMSFWDKQPNDRFELSNLGVKS